MPTFQSKQLNEKTQSNYYSNLELTTKGVKLFEVSALDILHAENLFKFGEIEQGFEYLKKKTYLFKDLVSTSVINISSILKQVDNHLNVLYDNVFYYS